MKLVTYYDILEVSKDASLESITAAYRKRAKEFHPDVTGDTASTKMMSLINMAYQTLKDPILRAEYDKRVESELAKKKAKSQKTYSSYKSNYNSNYSNTSYQSTYTNNQSQNTYNPNYANTSYILVIHEFAKG